MTTDDFDAEARATHPDHIPAETADALFPTKGTQVLHRWAIRDAERLFRLEEHVRWLERPWWRRMFGHGRPS